MKSVKELEQELELSNAKLSKMTSTVKQLGTKLSDANGVINDLGAELSFYKKSRNEMYDAMGKFVLTNTEMHERALYTHSMKKAFGQI